MYTAESKTIKVFATGLKGFKTIQGLRGKTNKIIVIIGKDINVKNDFSNEIETYCRQEDIKFYFSATHAEKYEFGLAIAAGWQRMIFDIPFSALIVFHDSLLPRYRGFNPLVTALLNKDDCVGVTALMAADKYDRGDILSQVRVSVEYPIAIKDAIIMVSDAYFNIAGEVYDLFISGQLYGKPQDESLATYSLWRDNDDYAINWNLDSHAIERHVNSVGYPYLGASSFVDGTLVRIKKVALVNDVFIENRVPGKIIFFENNMPVVVCGQGLLRLESIEDDNGNVLEINKLRTRLK
ncbi:methionyl-tRNA formyltransferase [Aeromonas caviae]